jgi:hypothetical protein
MLYGQSSGWWIRGNIESLIKYLQMIFNFLIITKGNFWKHFRQFLPINKLAAS